jgi:hypothetical protein
MPCDTRATKRGQTLSQRVAEVRGVVELAARKLASGQVRVKVGPQGGVLFTGLTESSAMEFQITVSCADLWPGVASRRSWRSRRPSYWPVVK